MTVLIKQLKHLATTLIIIVELWLYIFYGFDVFESHLNSLTFLAIPILAIILTVTVLFANYVINGKGNIMSKVLSTVIEWVFMLLLFVGSCTLIAYSSNGSIEEFMAAAFGFLLFTVVSIFIIIVYIVKHAVTN